MNILDRLNALSAEDSQRMVDWVGENPNCTLQQLTAFLDTL